MRVQYTSSSFKKVCTLKYIFNYNRYKIPFEYQILIKRNWKLKFLKIPINIKFCYTNYYCIGGIYDKIMKYRWYLVVFNTKKLIGI